MLKIFFAPEIFYRVTPLVNGRENRRLDAPRRELPTRASRDVAAEVHAAEPVRVLAGEALRGECVVFGERPCAPDSFLYDFLRECLRHPEPPYAREVGDSRLRQALTRDDFSLAVCVRGDEDCVASVRLQRHDDKFCLFLQGGMYVVVETLRDNRNVRSVVGRFFEREQMTYAVCDGGGRVFVHAARECASERGGKVLCDRRLFGEDKHGDSFLGGQS